MARKFDFVSPGIQLREIDESVLEPTPEKDGLLLIGRARSGPAMRPVKVTNLNDFVEIFGNPMDGVRQSDPWRFGNTGAPNYAAYAAQAYLAAGTGPVKFIRLLGKNGPADDAEVNKAGWTIGDGEPNNDLVHNTTAMALWLFPSASLDDDGHAHIDAVGHIGVTGTLGAIFYCSGTTPLLVGTAHNSTTKGATSAVVDSSGDNWTFDLAFTSSGNSTLNVTHSVSFDPTKSNYIRNVLNTDPTMYKGTKNYQGSVSKAVPYFLGETFDVNVSAMFSSSAGKVQGVILALTGNATDSFADHREEMTAARTGWFIGPRQGAADQKKLFYLTALSEGVELQNNYYVKISDCKLGTPPSGRSSFTLSIMKRGGANDVAVEVYSGLTMDPTDDDYIVKRIGDVNEQWNSTTDKFDLSGLYPNMSSYVRVTVNPEILPSGMDLPVGFVGPKTLDPIHVNGDSSVNMFKWLTGESEIPFPADNTKFLNATGAVDYTFKYPLILTTVFNSNGPHEQNYLATDVFGLRHNRKGTNSHSYSLNEHLRKRVAINPHLAATDALKNASFVFTLDDIRSGSATETNRFYFASGSFRFNSDKMSYSAKFGLTGSDGLFTSKGIRQFAAPFFGGSEGLDIRYANPFSNARLDKGANRYPQFTVNEALDMIEDRDNIRYELVSMPGIINDNLNTKLMLNSANRGDNLAIIDFSGIYRPGYDREDSALNSNILTMINKLETELVDNSYAATYYPNVRIRDTLNGNDTIIIAPPSVAAIGAIAKSEAMSQPWFAPAGFNRGGLNRLGGSLGPIVVGTVEHLTKAERDQLYEAHVNPIARFPATGDTVIFGQRTLQQAASALDRINVRRLLIYLKRHIGDIADTILFDQNVEATWNRFKARADAVLSEVKTELGITEYKLVLDTTTTTPDLIDRNILYAKIFIKPARAIEFIAIDFIITKTGVEFE